MNHSLRFLFWLALLLPASIASAQSDLPQPIAAARRAYVQTDRMDDYTLAQVPRRMVPTGQQGPPQGPLMRGPVYPQTWGPQFSPGHALVGAVIGFGLGAAAGSKNGVRSSIAVGTLVGLIGAATGAGIPSFPHYRRRGWDDDQDASRIKPKPAPPDPAQPETSKQVAATRSEPAKTYQKNDFSGR